jgi:hypothetical protein
MRPGRRRPIRLRLTLLYSSLFLLAGAVLLAAAYGLVAHSLDTGPPPATSASKPAYLTQAIKLCKANARGPVAVDK